MASGVMEDRTTEAARRARRKECKLGPRRIFGRPGPYGSTDRKVVTSRLLSLIAVVFLVILKPRLCKPAGRGMKGRRPYFSILRISS